MDHMCERFTPGCYRCELGQDEVRGIRIAERTTLLRAIDKALDALDANDAYDADDYVGSYGYDTDSAAVETMRCAKTLMYQAKRLLTLGAKTDTDKRSGK